MMTIEFDLGKRLAILLLTLLAGWYGGPAWGGEPEGDLLGRRLKATPVGGELQVNTYTTNAQETPAVAMDADGDFVVVWQSYGSSGADDNLSVQGQRYASDGTAVAAEFQVNTFITGAQWAPAVATAADGDFVVVWTSDESDIPEKRFETADPGRQDGDSASIQGRRYAADGSAVAAEFQVNTLTTDEQKYPAVAVDADGDFVVVWQSRYPSGSDTDGWSIQGRRYAADGSAVASEFQVNTYTTNGQQYPAVAVDADGDFVVVWQSYGSTGSDSADWSIQGQRYASDGSAVASEFQVNTYTTDYQGYPGVAVDADGDFVVVWQSYGSTGSDSAYWSIQGQRFAS
ncbi:MAG: hypothetical protein GY856_41890, partial [bacterium]|nr:hypothetical protein [bacterium]